MQRNHLLKKDYKQFLVKSKTRASRKFFIFELFFNFKNFHVFLIKLLNIISIDQNQNMHIFFKKNFQS